MKAKRARKAGTAGVSGAPPGRRARGRLPALLLATAALLLAAGCVWREPAQLWYLRRGPIAPLETWVRGNPDSARGKEALADAYLAAGRPQDAVALLSPVVAQDPADAAARVLLARALLAADRLPDAYAHLQTVVHSLQPENPEARWWLGQVLERMGNPDKAVAEYEAALSARPGDARVLVRLGALSVQTGRFADAERYYRRAAGAEPRSVRARAPLAEVLFRMGRVPEAVDEARRAVALVPEDARANFWLARSLAALDVDRFAAEAEAAYRKAVAASAEKAMPRYFLGRLLRQRGRAAEAAVELEATVRENPLHRDSYHELALCARMLGQQERFQSALARARRLSRLDDESVQREYLVWAEPENAAARLDLAAFYLQSGRPDLAQPQVDCVLQREPRSLAAGRLRARIQHAQSSP